MTITENLLDNQITCKFDCGYKVILHNDITVKDAAELSRVDHEDHCPVCMDKGDNI